MKFDCKYSPFTLRKVFIFNPKKPDRDFTIQNTYFDENYLSKFCYVNNKILINRIVWDTNDSYTRLFITFDIKRMEKEL